MSDEELDQEDYCGKQNKEDIQKILSFKQNGIAFDKLPQYAIKSNKTKAFGIKQKLILCDKSNSGYCLSSEHLNFKGETFLGRKFHGVKKFAKLQG